MTLQMMRQLEDTPEHFRTVLKAGGVLDVVERYPCAPAPRTLLGWLKRIWRVDAGRMVRRHCASDIMRVPALLHKGLLPALWLLVCTGGDPAHRSSLGPMPA